ncbi:hypothetical protein CYMTET_20746 [Cymbomonas tetramitiformis]|uniref:Uncharacterized protein n=1 Tax=Cymbomonas tetramitiformis TaxID=36881 RepID=A0AAE0G4Q4_9CHLO|nr:hypothetical protein CYMTET_20746 [Cymbomonas tetramitiformis]
MATAAVEGRGIYPLETPHGTLDEEGHIRYNLLKNCTTIDGKNLDENGFLANDFHITVGPMRVQPQQAVEFLGHMDAVLRGLHREHKDRHMICRQTPPRPRFHSGRVAALDIKFTKTEYATTVLATTLPLLPVNCYPIGGDLFTQEEPVFPRVRIFDITTRGGSDNRMLHVLSEELRGKSITDLEENLLEVEGLESAQKGHRLQQRVAAITANWLKLVAVSEEAAQKIENGTVSIPGINDYAVQRVALIKDVDKLAETEVVVVDTGSVIDPEFDTEALVRAVDDVFETALGEHEHLLPSPVDCRMIVCSAGSESRSCRIGHLCTSLATPALGVPTAPCFQRSAYPHGGGVRGTAGAHLSSTRAMAACSGSAKVALRVPCPGDVTMASDPLGWATSRVPEPLLKL